MTSAKKCRPAELGQLPIWTLTGKMQPDSSVQTVDVSKMPFRIGRRPDLELSVGSPVVSSTHAVIEEKGGALWLRDLGSTNGTFVNNEQVAGETLLAEGDWLELGDISLQLGVRKQSANEILKETADGFAMKTKQYTSPELEASRGLIELIEGRRLEACFQPIHTLTERDIHGYEFLARSELDGVSNPAAMFAAAEASGKEVELSLLCREMGVAHSICLPSALPLFLNTHPSESLLDTVVPQMQRLRSEWPARPMVLEIHERAIMEPGLVRSLRSALQEIEVQLAFDDFGAGQARFRELICAPSDYIKFDSALIHDLREVSKEQFGFFRAIIRGVKEEGALTVAEGIENEEMIEICHEIGFDLLQGYALSRPAIMSHPPEDEDTVDISD